MIGSTNDGTGDSYVGVGGHSGFLGSTMGLEMLGFFSADEEVRDDRVDDGAFPLMDIVSLDHEKARERRVRCVSALFSGVPGGVTSPNGMRASTSLCDRLSLRISSFSSMLG